MKPHPDQLNKNQTNIWTFDRCIYFKVLNYHAMGAYEDILTVNLIQNQTFQTKSDQFPQTIVWKIRLIGGAVKHFLGANQNLRNFVSLFGGSRDHTKILTKNLWKIIWSGAKEQYRIGVHLLYRWQSPLDFCPYQCLVISSLLF